MAAEQLVNCEYVSTEIGVAPQLDHIRRVSGHTRKFGGVLTFSSLRIEGAGTEGQNLGQPLAWSGKGIGQAGVAGHFDVLNSAGFNDVQAYRDSATGLITRLDVYPNAAGTEHAPVPLESGGTAPFARWSETPLRIGAREDAATQEQATARLERPLGPRVAYRMRVIKADRCDNGMSYLQDLQVDYYQPFAQSDGTIVFMFTNSQARVIEPATVAVIDTSEVVVEPAVSPEVVEVVVERPEGGSGGAAAAEEVVVVPAPTVPVEEVVMVDGQGQAIAPTPTVVTEIIPPEEHAILVHESDLPVVIDEVKLPDGETKVVEFHEGVTHAGGHHNGSGALVGANGAGQTPVAVVVQPTPPPVIYVDEAQAPAPLPNEPAEDVVVIGTRRYVPLGVYRPRRGTYSYGRRRRRSNRLRRRTRDWDPAQHPRVASTGRFRAKQRVWPWADTVPARAPGQHPGFFPSMGGGMGGMGGGGGMGGMGLGGGGGGGFMPTRNWNVKGGHGRNWGGGGGGGRWPQSSGGGGGGGAHGRTRAGAFGVDVTRKPAWKWGRTETGITIGVLAAGALIAWIVYKRRLAAAKKAGEAAGVKEVIDLESGEPQTLRRR